MLGKESIRPALMVPVTPAASAALALAQDAAQPHPHIAVQATESGMVAVLKVRKPPHKRQFASEMIASRLRPSVRLVLPRMASLSFPTLLRLGQR